MLTCTALVVGSGVAGLTAAQALAARGLSVMVVEQGSVVGGHAAGYACKAGADCVLCGVCLAAQGIRSLRAAPGPVVRVDTSVVALEGSPGRFTARLVQRARGIDVARCTACGLCVRVCPVGAISPLPWAEEPRACVLDFDACLRASGNPCALCREACPFGAVRLEPGTREDTVTAAVVVVATGFTPFPASAKSRFGYGRLPGVITTMDLEQGLRQQGTAYLEHLAPAGRRLAFVHCVGSRDVAAGRGWCSQVCCPTALRLARRLAGDVPDLEATLFFMDLQRCAPGIARLFRVLPPEIHLVRGLPAEVRAGTGGLVVTYEDLATATRCQGEFDVIVLAVGMDGPPSVGGLPEGTGGFLTDLPRGVVAAGACGGPVSIAEAAAEGLRAAGAALKTLEELACPVPGRH